jgi:hypothetical protein
MFTRFWNNSRTIPVIAHHVDLQNLTWCFGVFVAARAKITPRASGGKTLTREYPKYHNTRMVAKHDDKCNRDVHYMRHAGLDLLQSKERFKLAERWNQKIEP